MSRPGVGFVETLDEFIDVSTQCPIGYPDGDFSLARDNNIVEYYTKREIPVCWFD